jgi:hypothetical protein
MQMAGQPAILSAFPMGLCGTCDKTVLTHVGLDSDGREHRLCVHCDAPILERLDWVDAEELEATGYFIGSPPVQKACGTGCGTCATKRR